MQYLGGKARTTKKICQLLERIRGGRQFVEPFCGALWITAGMTGKRRAYDASPSLITMYKALQAGWVPPTTLTEKQYGELRNRQDATDPLTAFAGYGCSFGGKWFGGYARAGDRNYAANAKNSLSRKMAKCGDVTFQSGTYTRLKPNNALVYCDPPYAGTTGYEETGPFNHDTFWEWCRAYSKSNLLIVSEYTAPSDFKCVAEIHTMTDIRTTEGRVGRVERLFMTGSKQVLREVIRAAEEN